MLAILRWQLTIISWQAFFAGATFRFRGEEQVPGTTYTMPWRSGVSYSVVHMLEPDSLRYDTPTFCQGYSVKKQRKARQMARNTCQNLLDKN